tara:strand:- start:205 stop:384 length:180 start_codon:yes stop_codon:yes gene_type:complete
MTTIAESTMYFLACLLTLITYTTIRGVSDLSIVKGSSSVDLLLDDVKVFIVGSPKGWDL